MSNRLNVTPNDLSAFWMPFTANRQFKKEPRMLVAAKDMHYTSSDGRKIMDACAGLWCVNAGHCRDKITDAIAAQAGEMDYAPTFQMGHPKPFELANRLIDIAPDNMAHVLFTNSGSESVETALKVAIGYHRAKGNGSRTRLIGRERGYHGVNFGGISVGGIVANRKMFGTLLTGVDHLPHTHNVEGNAFSRGEPENGLNLADDLERIIALHDASTIAAVIVEPVAGSAGVLIPPKGYLKRLREICNKHDILLIFDEVITGFGRLGTPFAADYFDIKPDIITTAKGLTNGVIPMGAVFVTKDIHDAFMTGPEHVIEFFHGYTYSGSPIAAAAGLATQEIYREEGLLERATELAPHWEEVLHSLRDAPNVIDIRNIGLMGAIEMAPISGEPGKRGFNAIIKAFEKGVLIRTTGDTIALSPPLIITKGQIDELGDLLRDIIEAVA